MFSKWCPITKCIIHASCFFLVYFNNIRKTLDDILCVVLCVVYFGIFCPENWYENRKKNFQDFCSKQNISVYINFIQYLYMLRIQSLKLWEQLSCYQWKTFHYHTLQHVITFKRVEVTDNGIRVSVCYYWEIMRKSTWNASMICCKNVTQVCNFCEMRIMELKMRPIK